MLKTHAKFGRKLPDGKVSRESVAKGYGHGMVGLGKGKKKV